MARLGTLAWLLALVALNGACGASPPPAPVAPGDAEAPPSLASLPDLLPGGSADTDRTHLALAFARRVFAAGLPTPPSDHSAAVLQPWVEREVAGWIAHRRESVEQTDYQFVAEQRASAGERIVHQAVMGLLHEDTAQALENLPAPAELASEPEIAQMYREVLAAQAQPFVVAALEAFRHCANTAFDGPEDMRHWAAYCDGRFRRLRERLPKLAARQ